MIVAEKAANGSSHNFTMINSAGARGEARLTHTDQMEAEMTARSPSVVCHETVDQPLVLKAPVLRVLALAAGLGLGMLSYPVHAAPASGGDTVRGLYDALSE
jgi:hypothetical protein